MPQRSKLLAVALCALTAGCASSAPAHAQSWSAPADLATPLPRFDDGDPDDNLPELETNRRGDAIAVWIRTREGTADCCGDDRVMASFRPAGGRFGPARPISALGDDPSTPSVALDENGNATVAWTVNELAADNRVTRPRIGYADRPAGRDFQPARTLRSGGSGARQPRVLAVPGGETVIVWEEVVNDPGSLFLLKPVRINAAWRRFGGRFGEPQAISARNPRVGSKPGRYRRDSLIGPLAVGPRGEVLVPWLNGEGSRCCTALELSVRPPGGRFTASTRVAQVTAEEGIGAWGVTTDGERGALLLWSRHVPGEQTPRTELRYRDAGGELGPQETMETIGGQLRIPRVVFRGDGTAEALWAVEDQLRRATRPPGGRFAPSEVVAQPAGLPEAVLLADDSVLIAWERATGQRCDRYGCSPSDFVVESGVLPRSGPFEPRGQFAPKEAEIPTLRAAEGGAIALWARFFEGPQVAGFGIPLEGPPRGSTKQPRIARPAISGCGRPAPHATCTRSQRPALTFSLSEPATVAVRLCECDELDEGRSIRVIRSRGKRGANRVTIPPRMLAGMRRGRYTAALLAENAAGNDAARVRTLVLTLAGRP